MKKILVIITLSLLTSSNLFAENLNWFFNKWLSENGHHQYLNEQGSHNLNIKIKNKALSATNIAYHSNPNRDTLIYYLWKYSYRDRGGHLKEFKPTNDSYDFKFNLIEDEYLKANFAWYKNRDDFDALLLCSFPNEKFAMIKNDSDLIAFRRGGNAQSTSISVCSVS